MSDQRPGKARPRRGMYLLPSLFTAGNIAAGYFSITQTIEAMGGNAQMHLDWAAIAILFAIPFDALDGRIARMTNTTSEFGKELDSLADVIAFGVAPSLLAFVWGFHFLPQTLNAQCITTCCKPGSSSASSFCFAALRGWRGSTSATIRSRATQGGRGASILWACRFRRQQDFWPQRFTFATEFR